MGLKQFSTSSPGERKEQEVARRSRITARQAARDDAWGSDWPTSYLRIAALVGGLLPDLSFLHVCVLLLNLCSRFKIYMGQGVLKLNIKHGIILFECW
jgi:hypothetical protein